MTWSSFPHARYPVITPSVLIDTIQIRTVGECSISPSGKYSLSETNTWKVITFRVIWFAVNNDFLWAHVEGKFPNGFQEWLSHEWKVFANHEWPKTLYVVYFLHVHNRHKAWEIDENSIDLSSYHGLCGISVDCGIETSHKHIVTSCSECF